MRFASWLVERFSSLQARRFFALGALVFVGGGFATFEACTSRDSSDATQSQPLQSSGDPAGNRGGLGRTGEYIDTTLTVPQVSSNTFGRAPTAYAVDGPIYAQPLVVQGVQMQSDYKRNLLLVATTNNSLYAFDADKIGDPIWGPVSFGTPPMWGTNNLHHDDAGDHGIFGNPTFSVRTSASRAFSLLLTSTRLTRSRTCCRNRSRPA